MSELIDVACTHCGYSMQTEPGYLGQEAPCTSCGNLFLLWPANESKAASKQWQVMAGDQELGPFDPNELRKFAAMGKIGPETLVRRGAEGPWTPARLVRGLLDQSKPTATQAPAATQAPTARAPAATKAPAFARTAKAPKPPASRGSRPSRPARGASKRGGEARPPAAQGEPDLARRLASQPGLVLAMGVGALVIVGLVVMLATKKSSDPKGKATSVADAKNAVGLVDSKKVKKKRKPRPVLTTKQIVAKSAPSVGIVMGREGSGTGFLIERNVIATNKHVIDAELLRNVRIQFPDAEKYLRGSYGIKLIYEDPDLDLAFLEVTIDLPPLHLAKRHKFSRGEEISIIGSPGVGNGQILSNAVSRGLLSTEHTIEGQTYHQLDAAVNPGNSGGPVFNDRGEVIGVVTLKASGKDGLGFSLPLHALRSSWARAKQNTQVDRSRMASAHRYRVIASAVMRSGALYSAGCKIYVSAMQTAMDEGKDLNVGLRAALKMLRWKLTRIDQHLLALMRTDAPKVLVDTSLPDAMRTRFTKLWSTYQALKDHASNPKGTFDSFKKLAVNLALAHERVATQINVADGIEVPSLGEFGE